MVSVDDEADGQGQIPETLKKKPTHCALAQARFPSLPDDRSCVVAVATVPDRSIMCLVRVTLWLPECTSIGGIYVLCRYCWKKDVLDSIWKKTSAIAAIE